MEELFSYIAQNYWGFILSLVRLSILFVAFPFFSTPFVPRRVKVALILALTLSLSSSLGVGVSPPGSYVEAFLLVLSEALLGFLFALVGAIFYGVVTYAGELVSYLMGLTVANLFDPTFGMVSVLGRLFVFTFYAVFFATGGAELFLGALWESFKLIPPGSFGLKAGLFSFFIKEGGALFYLAFKLAFPFLFALFLTNLALALVNRLIPQINVFIVGLPLQVFVGLLVLSVGYGVVVYFNVSLSQRFLESLFNLLRGLKGG